MKNLRWLVVFLVVQFVNIHAQLKILHIGFHFGCLKAFESVAEHLDVQVTSLMMSDFLKMRNLENEYCYNIGHRRAEVIWNAFSDYFNEFDVVMTSDTGPLARIFLQNNLEKHLVIWICNRFDYYDSASLDCDFPDKEFYDLYRKASTNPKVTIVNYTKMEHVYALSKGVNTGNVVIKPYGVIDDNRLESYIPSHISKEDTFFIPPYHNDTYCTHLLHKCERLKITAYQGSYHGPQDIKDFKGIIHIPYAWSNVALFENFQLGLVYFIPTKRFFSEIRNYNEFFFQDPEFLEKHLDIAEFYDQENAPYIVYFDSWKDLKRKIKETDFSQKREEIKEFGLKKRLEAIQKWKEIFENIKKNKFQRFI